MFNVLQEFVSRPV